MKTILSIDGGGIRGIIPATVLSYFEEKLNKPISSLFDFCVGTSTGGIICLALNIDDGNKHPKYSAKDIVDLYDKNGSTIFPDSFLNKVYSVGGNIGPLYDSKGIEEVLLKYFNSEMLSSVISPVMVTAYDIEKREPVFLKSWKEKYSQVLMRDGARATSAAPTYFEPAYININNRMRALVDGGVFVNNPSVSAYAEAKRIFDDHEEYMVVSLGTGELIRPIEYKKAKNWGRIGWALPVLSAVFDGVSDAAHYQMHQILGADYYRLQTELEYASDDMDDASSGNIIRLKREANKLIKDNHAQIDMILDRLAKH